MARKFKENLFIAVAPEVEAAARADYEAALKRVGGRPAWERLDHYCAYDMGMRAHANERATAQLANKRADEELAAFVNDIKARIPLDWDKATDARGNPIGWEGECWARSSGSPPGS